MDRSIERSIDRPIERLIDFRSADIIDSGPIASAPVASEALLGSYFIQTDDVAWPSGRRWLYHRAFKNEGVDYISLGRPSWINSVNPNQAFSMMQNVKIQKDARIAQYLLGLVTNTGDSASGQQITILFIQSTNTVSLRVGGVEKASVFVLPSVPTALSLCLASNGTTSNLFINGVKVIDSLINGSYQTNQPINIFGYAFNSSFNADGFFHRFAVYSGDSVDGTCGGLSLIDSYDMSGWSGSSSGVSLNGNTYSIVSGTPFSEFAVDLFPADLLT